MRFSGNNLVGAIRGDDHRQGIWALALFGAKALALSGLLVASAKVNVPFYPVPMTLQTFAVVLLGALFGARLGLAAVATYLIEGALGLPVFSGTPQNGIGIAYMVGPTGGYLLGFILAAPAVGYMIRFVGKPGFLPTALALAISIVIIYLPGLAWLAIFVGVDRVYGLGVQPFLLAEITKIMLAAVIVTAFGSRFRVRE